MYCCLYRALVPRDDSDGTVTAALDMARGLPPAQPWAHTRRGGSRNDNPSASPLSSSRTVSHSSTATVTEAMSMGSVPLPCSLFLSGAGSQKVVETARSELAVPGGPVVHMSVSPDLTEAERGATQIGVPESVSHISCGSLTNSMKFDAAALFFTQPTILSCAPGAHWDAFGLGSSHCISWCQIQPILTTCDVLYDTVLWDNCSTGQL